MEHSSLPPIPSVVDLPIAGFETAERSWSVSGLDAQDHIFRWIAAESRFYEEQLLQLLKQLVGPGGHVVDVGANIGNHTLWFAGAMQCTVRAFEPIQALCAVLAHNVAQNRLDGQVRVEPYGVGRTRGTAQIAAWDETNTGASSLRSSGPGGPISIVALDDLTWEQSVDLLKIDVEGMEMEVLDGALGIIRRDRPVLAVEARSPEEQGSLRQWFQKTGYHVLATLNATPTLVAVPGGPQPPIEPLARTVEHLMHRFDEFEQKLGRFGRYVQKLSGDGAGRGPDQVQAAVEPVSPGQQDQTVRLLQERIQHLEGQLDVLRRRPEAAPEKNDTTTPETRP